MLFNCLLNTKILFSLHKDFRHLYQKFANVNICEQMKIYPPYWTGTQFDYIATGSVVDLDPDPF